MHREFFTKNYVTLLIAILFFAFFSRIYQLHIPERYIFDEVYHAVTAKLIAQNDPRAFEWWNPPPETDTAIDWLHPPLAKYTQALSMNIFGENAFAWRLSSALFGVAVIFLVAVLSLRLTKDHSLSLLAALVASLDGLLLVMSRIAMNDIHVTFAVLLTLVFYLRTKPFETKTITGVSYPSYLLTGIMAGVAIGTKWSGIFVLGIIYFYEALQLVDLLATSFQKKSLKKEFSKYATQIALLVLFFCIVPIIVYIFSYSQMFLQGKDFNHFIELHKQIWAYQSSLVATHDYQSTPIDWLLNRRPVWFHVVYEPGKRGDIYAHGNSILLWSGLAAIIALSLRTLKKILNITESKIPIKTLLKILRAPMVFTLVSYFSMWIVWTNSPRIMFFYHYTPAIPFLSIILAYFLVRLYRLGEIHQPASKAISITIVGLAILYFLIFIPHWLGIPVRAAFVEGVYFMFDSWK